MQNVSQGNAVTSSQPTPSAHRRNLLDLLAAAPVITSEEYDTATARILACASLPTLAKWWRNCLREIARREQALGKAPLAPVTYATMAQTTDIHRLALHVSITPAERTQALACLPCLDYVGAVAVIGDLYQKVMQRTVAQVSVAAPVLLPRYSPQARQNRQQASLLELRLTLPAALAAYDRAVASRALRAQHEPTYYLENVAEGWDLEEQGSRLTTSALLLGFADLAEARRALPLPEAGLPEWSAPAEVSYFQAC